MVSRVVAVLLLASSTCLVSACVSSPTDCTDSAPLADGATTMVEVVVVTKEGLNANVIGTLDVNDGLYSTPQKPINNDPTTTASVTDLPLGEYEGTVAREGDELTLTVEGQEFSLNGPESCD